MRRAVIDVGSNSLLLLVAEQSDAGWTTIHESTAVTGLGEGTKTTGVLSQDAMKRTLEALETMFAEAKAAGVETVCAGATMAARIASNTDEFIEQSKRQGTPVFVLHGNDEAELGFRAVAEDPKLGNVARLTIIDPGGHSTEMVTADQVEPGEWNIRYRRSFPIGTLALRDELPSGESPAPLDLLRACAQLDDTIGLCYRPNQAGRVVVLGASGTNLVSVRDRLPDWQPDRIHGAILDYEEVSRAVGWLSAMTDEERAKVPGMEKGREKTIHLGALILERFMFAARTHDCVVSVRGWRHALLERPELCVRLQT